MSKVETHHLYPLPDFGDLIFLLILYFLFFVSPTFIFNDCSTGWHLVTGHYILSSHSIPKHDLISYTFPNAPWVPYEWLSDLLFAYLTKVAGLNGLAVAVNSIIALTFLLLYKTCRKRGMNMLLAVLLIIIAALASSVHWLARPHIFTFIGVYIFSTALESFHRQEINYRKLLFVLSISMLLWANLHPGFLIGIILIVIYLICETITWLCTHLNSGDSPAVYNAKIYLLTLGTVCLTSLINPFGINLYKYILHYLQSSQVLSVTNEFQSPVFNGQIQSICLEIILFLMVLSLVLGKKCPSFPQFITCLAFAHLALSAVRHIPLFVIVALPFIADLISEIKLPFYLQNKELEPALWLTQFSNRLALFFSRLDKIEFACQMHILPVVIVLVLFYVATNNGYLCGQKILACGFNISKVPDKTLEYICADHLSPQAGFNFDNWGGYIRYHLGIPVFIDDRLDFYGKNFYFDYAAIFQAQSNWSELLDNYHINWILIPKDCPLTNKLNDNLSWHLACTDAASNLFVRK